MSRRHPDPPLFTITRLREDVQDVTTEALTGMAPWRKAVLAAAFATSPAPVLATITNGMAGWTALLFVADVAAVVGVAISHGLAEARPDRVPAATIGIDLDDDRGHIHYDARITEAA